MVFFNRFVCFAALCRAAAVDLHACLACLQGTKPLTRSGSLRLEFSHGSKQEDGKAGRGWGAMGISPPGWLLRRHVCASHNLLDLVVFSSHGRPTACLPEEHHNVQKKGPAVES